MSLMLWPYLCALKKTTFKEQNQYTCMEKIKDNFLKLLFIGMFRAKSGPLPENTNLMK